MESAFEILKQGHLAYELTPISIRELLFINDAPCDIFGLENGLYKRILHKMAFINKPVIKKLIQEGQIHLFVYHQDRQKLIDYIQTSLVSVTRSLSVGDPVEKGLKQMNLLTINMSYLYKNPTNDELLQLQYQSAKNLAYFLMDKVHIHEQLFQLYTKQKHFFIFSQPLLSSLFVLGILKFSRRFTDQDIENIFIASYFKDIGMSAIPEEKYIQEELTAAEKVLLSDHATSSVNILKGRIPLTPNLLTVIESHHCFSMLSKEIASDIVGMNSDNTVSGVETLLVSVMDIVSAMIAGRPFRKATNLFESLELIKGHLDKQYPSEFRMIVTYFKNFFFNKRP